MFSDHFKLRTGKIYRPFGQFNELLDAVPTYLGMEPPELFDKDVKTPEKALFETKLGKLAKIFNFVIKGQTSEADKAIKVLTRIEDPNEILEQSSEQGKFLMKKFKLINYIRSCPQDLC